MRRIGSILAAALILTATLLVTSPARAAYTQDDGFFNSNTILFYCKKTDDPNNKCGQNACSAGTSDSSDSGGSATSLGDLKPTDTLKTIFQGLINGGMTSVQAAAVMGNMYVESGHTFDPDTYENGVNVPASGYGLVQWTNNRPDYTSGRRTNEENYARDQGKPKSDLSLQIKFLLKEYDDSYKASLSGSAFATGTNIADSTRAWMNIFERPAVVTGPDPSGLTSLRIPAAKKIYGFYQDLAPSTPSSDATATASTCNGDAGGSGSAVAGDIVKTAIGYAWPTPAGGDKGPNKEDATQAYQTDRPKYDTDGNWSGCDVFVAVVMRASGVDKNYWPVSVHAQKHYVETHPELYEIIEKPTRSQLQPGDILLSDSEDGSGGIGHTVIYIGSDSNPAHGSVADASNLERVPSIRYPNSDQLMINEHSILARYRGPKS